MANFAKKLKEATEEDLNSWINELDYNVASLASDELTRRYLRGLRKSIKLFNQKSSIQTDKMIFLTTVIAILTIVMVIGLAMQLWFAVKQTNYTEIQSRSERIQQAKITSSAVEFCEQNPEAEESGLFEISNGKPASCKQVLEIYKN